MKVTITAHTSSKKPRVEIDMFKNMHVYVREPAIEGKANLAITEVLAKKYKVSKTSVRIISGEWNKTKIFEVDNSKNH